MYSHVVTKAEEGQRFDRFLAKLLPNAGSSFLYKMLRKKNIMINHKKSDGNQKISEGDLIEIYFSDETLQTFMGKSFSDIAQAPDYTEFESAFGSFGEVEILFENEHILVVNKPAGILSQKSEKKDVSLNEWLVGYLLHNGFPSEQLKTFRPSVCNRLDRNTSGLVLCSKTRKGAEYLSQILKDRSLSKFYLAPVKGSLTAPMDVYGYLMKDEKTNKVKVLEHETKNSSLIHTSFVPLFSFDLYDGTECTMLKIHLHTGKSHQIRAHLASLGHPILGDPKYGDTKCNDAIKKRFGITCQLLHGFQVVFPKEATISDLAGLEIICNPPTVYYELTGKDILEIS